jgi:hypothetical protein
MAALGPGVYSASNRNNVFGEQSGGGRVRLTNLPPYLRRMSRHCGILKISQSYRPTLPLTRIPLLFYDFILILLINCYKNTH